MEKDKSIGVLNALITINNDRIEGYKTASEETEEVDLKVQRVEKVQVKSQIPSYKINNHE